jgi:SAM-dependent methyltransferase
VDEYVLRSCPACSFTWSARAIDDFHSSADYSDYGDGYLANQTIERIKFWIKLTFFRRREFNAIRSAGTIEKARLLDVGAGAGFFVANCRSRGIEAYGVEPSARLREFALRVFALELFPSIDALDEAIGVRPFDVITSHDVIEHIAANHLPSYLSAIHRHLRDGGYFLGNTPNFESLNIRWNGAGDPVISPPHHCVYFSCDTLDQCLTRHGFAKDMLLTSGLSAFFLPTNGSPLIAKASIVLQKSLFNSLWPLLSIFKPRSGYQIFFAFRKAAQQSADAS